MGPRRGLSEDWMSKLLLFEPDGISRLHQLGEGGTYGVIEAHKSATFLLRGGSLQACKIP